MRKEEGSYEEGVRKAFVRRKEGISGRGEVKQKERGRYVKEGRKVCRRREEGM